MPTTLNFAAGTPDVKVFTPISSALANLPNGAGTMIALLRRTSVTNGGDFCGLLNSGGTNWYHTLASSSTTNLFDDDGLTGPVAAAGLPTSTTDWLVVAIDWAAGAASLERTHWRDWTTAGSWTHTNTVGNNGGNRAGPGTSGWFRLGYCLDSDVNGFDLGLVAIWAGTRFADADYQSWTKTSDLWNHSAGHPTFLVECTASTLVDLVGGSTYSSANSSGTTLTGSSPPWTFDQLGATTPGIGGPGPMLSGPGNHPRSFAKAFESAIVPPTVVQTTSQAPLVVTPPTPVPPGGTQITKGRDGVVISTPLAPTVVTRPTPDVPGKTITPPARDGITRATPLPPTVVTTPAPAPVPQIVTRSAVAGICVPGTGGPLWANTGTNDASVGTVAWANTANIPLAPFPKAGLATGNQSQWLTLGTYGFSIPSTAIIQGIGVSLTRGTNLASNVTDTGVRLIKGGVIGATDRSDPGVWSVGDTVVNYGGPADLWGDTWTPADINAGNFGLALTVTNTGSAATAHLDANSIAVYYCDPFGAPSVATPEGQVVTQPTVPVAGMFLLRVGDPTASPFTFPFTPAPLFVTSPTPQPIPQTLIRRGTDDALQVGTITPQPTVISARSVVPLPEVLIVKGGVTSVQVEASGQTDIVFGSTAIPTVSASASAAIIFNATGVPTESATGTSSIIFNSTGAGTTPGGATTYMSMRGVNSAFVNVASATTDAPFTGGIVPAARAGQVINVLAVTFNADTAADTIVFNSKGAGAGTAISALFSNPINGSVVWPFTPVGWFTTNGGEQLTVTTTGASPTHVQIIFEYLNA